VFRESIKISTRVRAGLREGAIVKLVRHVKHLLLTDLYRPNIFKLIYFVHRLLKKRDTKILLMASSPPFSLAVVGAILKRWHGSKVVLTVDMRDAWALHNALGGIKSIKRNIECAVLRSADSVSTVSKWLANEFSNAYGINVEVMYNVATHYTNSNTAIPIAWADISKEISNTRLKLVYTGATPPGYYDIKSLVGGIVTLRSKHPEIADRIQLVFVGACGEVQREAKFQGVQAGDIVFVSHLPHRVVRQVQMQADVLLFLAHFGEGNKGVVSTKLFEYLYLGKPILPISLCEDSDVDQLLHRYCGCSLNAHSSEAIMQVIASLVANGTQSLPKLDESIRLVELLDNYNHYAKRLLGSA
jgi:hypothetical protein